MENQIEQIPVNAMKLVELSTAELISIDKCCTEYEQALINKEDIPIEHLLDSVTAGLQQPLFKELLYHDLAYRRRRGYSINRDEYHIRFPDFADLIDEVWLDVFAHKELSSSNATSNTSSNNVSSGLTIPGYEIKTRLARGGMGVVYLAHDKSLNREVAIKMLSGDSMSIEQVKRFQMEAKAIGALHHRNIIQIYSVGEHHGQPYLVLEYANAGTLKDRLEKASLQRDDAIKIMMTLAKTIEFVHENGFLHRDIKPSNVLFDKHDNIKISDFGLAKNISSITELTQTQTQIGTPAYMAPEQVDKGFGDVSQLSDIYALGVLMHVMLTGVTPYHGLDTMELLKELTSEKNVPKEYLLDQHIDKAMMTVCLRCLEKQSKYRYQSANLLFEDLKRLQTNKPVNSLFLYRKYVGQYLKVVTVSIFLLVAVGLLWERSKPPVIEIEKTSLLSSKVIAQLDPAILATLNTPYQGEDNFKLVTLIPNKGIAGLQLNAAQGLALYQDRYLYIADTLQHRVLMIDLTTGDIAHVAGNGEASYSGDNGFARNATLNQPVGLDVDASGNLYITDRGNHAVRIVDTDGIITTLFGGLGCKELTPFSNIPDLCYPSDISVVSEKEYYIADAFHQRIRYTQNNKASTVFTNESADTQMDFNPLPRATIYDDGLLYFIEGHDGRLQSLDKNGALNTIAERFIEPSDISIDNKGNIYISDEIGYPISRVNKASGEIEVLTHASLFPDLENSSDKIVTAITVANDNRVYFSDAIDNSVAVIIPNKDKPELEMARREKENTPQQIQYPLTRLDEIDQFNYIETNRQEFFSDIANKLGLHLYIHHSSNVDDVITIREDRFSARKALILGCLVQSVCCGIEGNTLIVAENDIFSSITSAIPLKIDNPLSWIDNSAAMPAHLRQEAERKIKIEAGSRRAADEFFWMLEELTRYRFEIDPAMLKLGDGRINLDGTFNLGQLLAVFVMWEKIKLSYNEGSGKLVVSPWTKT